MSQSSRPSRTSRRKFLRGAAVVTAATVTAPTVVSAQGPINLRWQSTWPSKDIFHEYALDYAKNRSARSSSDRLAATHAFCAQLRRSSRCCGTRTRAMLSMTGLQIEGVFHVSERTLPHDNGPAVAR